MMGVTVIDVTVIGVTVLGRLLRVVMECSILSVLGVVYSK